MFKILFRLGLVFTVWLNRQSLEYLNNTHFRDVDKATATTTDVSTAAPDIPFITEIGHNWNDQGSDVTNMLLKKQIDAQKDIKLASNVPKESPLSPWVDDYISFHRSSIKDGKLIDGVKYIVYQCKDGPNRCGGSGDRLVGMIKMFYLAMSKKRVLLIDSPFPTPLTDVFNPLIEWNATYPETQFESLDMYDGVELKLGDELGYFISRTNGIPAKKSLDMIWTSSLMVEHLQEQQWYDTAKVMSLAKVAREGFRAMFEVSNAVKTRAKELKKSAGLLGLYDIPVPYVGIHIRTGDANLGVEGTLPSKTFQRATRIDETLRCYRQLKETHLNFEVAYLASDDISTKEKIQQTDLSIHHTEDLQPFHIDLKVRSGTNTKFHEVDPEAVYNGVIDTWAEMAVLADSACLVLTKSMFVFSSSHMRDPSACSVLIDHCEDAGERKGHNEYFGENIARRGFVVDTFETQEL